MLAQPAITFELRLVIGLIRQRRLLWKARVLRRVVQNVGGFISVQNGLDVKNDSRRRALAVHVAVPDASQRTVQGFLARSLLTFERTHRRKAEFDGDPEVDADLAQGIAQILELVVRVASAV